MKKRWPLLITTLILLLSASPIWAQEPTADEVNAVAKHLNCPTCNTRSLDACDTQTCIQWKEQIKDLMIQGYTEEEILEWYVERYGEYVLQEPLFSGLGLFAWLLPVLGLLGGAVWLGIILRNWSAKKTAPVVAETSPDLTNPKPDDYLRQVEQDLKDL